MARITTNEVYFEPGMYAKVQASPGTLKAVVAAIAAQAGVRRVFTSDEIAHAANASDPDLRAAALSYVPGRSGDLVISPRAGWIISGTGTTHGSANPDDQRVPLVLFGQGVKAGRYDTPASPADVAPTLASIVGVALPDAEGKVLTEALR